MTRYFYDLELLERGRIVDLISIGIVCEDGREYYAVADEITRGKPLRALKRNTWLMNNIVPALPKPHGDWNTHMPRRWLFDYMNPAVKPREKIADEVRKFLLSKGTPELWADHGAYDHVALCQLWGDMTKLPLGLPKYTNDIMQEARRLGYGWEDLPMQPDGRHNALADARHNQAKHAYLCHVDEVRRSLGAA